MPADLDELETLAAAVENNYGTATARLVREAVAEIREHREVPDYRSILLQFIASLTLADHMGDAANDVGTALKRMRLKIAWNDWPELARALHKMGVTTLYGTKIGDDEDDE